MTTKALIYFAESNVSVVKVFDGSPEHVLPILETLVARAPMFDPTKGSPDYRADVYDLEIAAFIARVVQQFSLEDYFRMKDMDEAHKAGKRWFAGGYAIYDRTNPSTEWHWKFVVRKDGSIYVSPAQGPAYIRTYAEIIADQERGS